MACVVCATIRFHVLIHSSLHFHFHDDRYLSFAICLRHFLIFFVYSLNMICSSLFVSHFSPKSSLSVCVSALLFPPHSPCYLISSTFFPPLSSISSINLPLLLLFSLINTFSPFHLLLLRHSHLLVANFTSSIEENFFV